LRSTRAMRPARTMDAIIKLGERLKNLKSQTKEAGFGGEGTGAPPYELTFGGVERAFIQVPGAYIEHGPSENFFASITAMPAYKGKSFEELRLEDYAKGVGPAPVGTPSKPKKKSLIPRAAALFAKTVRRSPSKGGSDANLAPQRGWGAVDATLPPGPPAAAPPPPVDAAALARDAAARRIEAALSRARAAGVPVTVNGAEAYGPAWVAKSVRQAAFPETFADRVESAMAKRVDAVLSKPRPPMRPVRRKVTARMNPRRGEERVMLRCRRVYFGTKLQPDVTVVFAPSCVALEWRSDTSGKYIEARLAPSHMTSFDMYHGPVMWAPGEDCTLPGAIREFFAIGLRQKPPHLRSVEGWEPTDDWGPRKYVVVVLEGEALATVKREAVPAVVWGGRLGWPAAPVLGTAAAARPFLEGVSVVDAALRGAALRNSLCEAPSARGNMLLKSQAARAIMDDPLLREAAIAGTLTRKMVRKALIARSDTCATEIEVMILKMRRSFKDDIKAGIRTAAKILRTQARQARRLCDVCGGRGPLDQEAFPSCGGCGARRYCSGVCQRDDWVAGGHSSVCPWCPDEL